MCLSRKISHYQLEFHWFNLGILMQKQEKLKQKMQHEQQQQEQQQHEQQQKQHTIVPLTPESVARFLAYRTQAHPSSNDQSWSVHDSISVPSFSPHSYDPSLLPVCTIQYRFIRSS
jgi:cell division protein FtsN